MNETEQLHRAASRFSEMKILISDDELANVALLEDILSDSGYTQVKSIIDPRLTMQTCAEFEPDVVLLDLRMPHMDGFAVLEALRAKSTGTFLPVIVLTADIDAQSKYRALRAGATDYLLKPFDHLEVLLRMGLFMEDAELSTRSITKKPRPHLMRLSTGCAPIRRGCNRFFGTSCVTPAS